MLLSFFATQLGHKIGDAAAADPGSPAVSGNEAGALGGWQRGDRARRKKLKIQADDEEFMLMAQSALAEILKKL